MENAINLKKRLPDIIEIFIKRALQVGMRAIKIYFVRYDEYIESENKGEELTPDRIIEIIRNANKEIE